MTNHRAARPYRPRSTGRRATTCVVAAAGLFAAVACNHASPTEAQVNGRVTHTITADAGSDFDIVLQTIGPGHYTESPSISSGGVQFQSVAYVGPFVPAGPTQQYRFHAASAGTVVITFQHTEDNPTVQDAVIVK